MLKLNVPDMSCEHCVSAVTKALKSVDASADVVVDLNNKTVSVKSDASQDKITAALVSAGYESSPAA